MSVMWKIKERKNEKGKARCRRSRPFFFTMGQEKRREEARARNEERGMTESIEG